MNQSEVKEIKLSKITEILPSFSENVCLSFAEAGAVCFEDQNHNQGVELKVNGSFNAKYKIYWPNINEQMLNFWNDQEVTTEYGAYCMSFFLINYLTNYKVKQRSWKGTGFDYWLGKNTNNELLFQNLARLEVSGIRNGNINQVKTRVKKKLNQVKTSNNLKITAYIVVVEFSKPLSQVVEK